MVQLLWKKFKNTFNRIPACDRQTDGQTSCDDKVLVEVDNNDREDGTGLWAGARCGANGCCWWPHWQTVADLLMESDTASVINVMPVSVNHLTLSLSGSQATGNAEDGSLYRHRWPDNQHHYSNVTLHTGRL